MFLLLLLLLLLKLLSISVGSLENREADTMPTLVPEKEDKDQSVTGTVWLPQGALFMFFHLEYITVDTL